MLINIKTVDICMQQTTMTLETLLLKDSELSSLPEIYLRVSELLENEDSTSAQIGQLVETDPALTTRILKMVNSAFYGFPHEIATISQSISILGRDRLRQILIGSMLGGVFGKMGSHVISLNDFWYDSVKTAILARYLCRESRNSDQAETIFTAGLLHKIGKLILAQRLPDEYMRVQITAEAENLGVFELEQRIIGFTHCDVGAAFIGKWGLPQILSDIAHYYLSPQQSQDYAEEVRLISLASKLTFLVAPVEQQEVEYVLEDIPDWQEAGLTVAQITAASILAEEQVYEVMDSLGMGQIRIEDDD